MTTLPETTLSEEWAARTAAVFQVLADPTRVRVLHALSVRQHTTGELADVVELSDSAVSHQLRSLRLLGMVVSRRQGKQVWHELADDHVRSLLTQGLEHAREPG